MTLTAARKAMLKIKNGCNDVDTQCTIINDYLETLPALMITIRNLEKQVERLRIAGQVAT